VLALCVWAAPSDAVVANIGGHGYGLTPIRGVNPASLPSVQRALRSSGVSATGPLPYDKTNQLTYHGGPVMHSVTTHVVYWDPSGEFTATTKSIVKKFFTDLSADSGLATNVMGIAGQYGDGTGHTLYSSTFAGEATDGTAYPTIGNCTIPAGDPGPPYTKCLTDAQLKSELEAFIETEHLPKGPTQQYFALLPHKVVTCLPEFFEGKQVCSNDFYCAYHSSIKGGTVGEIIYSDIPFSLLDSGNVKGCQSDGIGAVQHPNGDNTGSDETTKFADVALKYTSHEYTEAATDPLGNAWWENAHGQENGDKCNYTGSGFEPGEDPNAFLPTLGGSTSPTLYDQLINGDHFYIQSEWDNAGKACLMQPLTLSGANFTTSPTSGAPGSPVKFSGAATDPYGGLGFTWKFGDGTESAASSPEHVYGAPGSYEVTMTAKDAFTASTATPVVRTFVVADEQPTAAFTVEPNPAVTGGAVKFNGGASSDPDGSITGYAWKFGDGAEATGIAPEHAYVLPGVYTVTLTVTDSASATASTSSQVTVAAPASVTSTGPTTTATTATTATTPAPSSSFGAVSASLDQNTGAITFTESVGDPGSFSWLLTFQNGKFGVFAASTSKCKKGYVKLNGKCRPSKIVYAKGRKAVAAPGTVTFTIKPSRSALTALKNALKRKKGLPVTITLTFQSSRGGSPVSQTRTVTVKLKKK
jgi:PKD repeat protein